VLLVKPPHQFQHQHQHHHHQGAAVADHATSLAFVPDGLLTADEALHQEANRSIPFAAAHAVAVQQPHQHQHQHHQAVEAAPMSLSVPDTPLISHGTALTP